MTPSTLDVASRLSLGQVAFLFVLLMGIAYRNRAVVLPIALISVAFWVQISVIQTLGLGWDSACTPQTAVNCIAMMTLALLTYRKR